MYLVAALVATSVTASGSGQEGSLLAAVPEDAFGLLRVADPRDLRARAEHNDWVSLLGSPEGEPALVALEREYEVGTGTDFDGLFTVVLELDGEAVLFVSEEVAGFLTEPPPDPTALAAALNSWLGDEPQSTLEVAGGRVRLAAWPESEARAGHFLAFLDHPSALGLYSGDSAAAVVEALQDSLRGLEAGRRAPVVDGFLSAGGGTTRGIEAFLDLTPFVPEAERVLRDLVADVLPDPTGLLGLERDTSLFASANVFHGAQLELRARLQLPPGTLAARLADTFEPLPSGLPADLPRGTWALSALNWSLGRFYAVARDAFEEATDGGLSEVDRGLAAARALSGVDPIEDVVNQLSGLFAWFHVLDAEATPPAVEGLGFLAGLVDGERFLEALEDVMDAGGLGADAIELEGAEAYLWGTDSPGSDGGMALLPDRLVIGASRETLVRGLRALGRQKAAALADGSPLRAALRENAGACGLGYAELAPLRVLVASTEPPSVAGAADSGARDPFDSRLIVSAQRTLGGFDVWLRTR